MPPKKKKTPPKNAYYFFMMEFRANQELGGVHFNTLKDVAEAASNSWKSLDAMKRQHYENMAERAKVAGNGGVRYTTQGQTFDEVDRERIEAEQKKQIMLNTIQLHVVSGGRHGLKSRRFYFIHVNHYGVMEGHRFMPCEVAFLAYSIEAGFEPQNIYHEFISNSEVPNGYTFRAISHKEVTHKCPLPPFALGTANHQRVYESIIRLMEKNGDCDEGRPPPIYTLSTCIPEAEDFFYKGNQFLHDSHHVTRIYPLEELFFRMKNFGLKPQGQHLFFNGVEDNGFPFLTNASDIIRGDIYDYASGIACKYHEDEDVRQHCSRSYVIRWSYLLSDHLCANLDVKIVSKRHTPRGTNLNAIKITSEMDRLRLRDPVEAPRESCGRGKPVEGRTVPTSRPVFKPMMCDPYDPCEPSTSRCSSRASSSLGQNEGKLTIIDHSKFQQPPVAPIPNIVSDVGPLRAPKARGKSSLLLNAMNATAASGSLGNGLASPLGLGGVGRGRGVHKNA